MFVVQGGLSIWFAQRHVMMQHFRSHVLCSFSTNAFFILTISLGKYICNVVCLPVSSETNNTHYMLSFLGGPGVLSVNFYCYRTAELTLNTRKCGPGTPTLDVPDLLDFVPKSGGLPKLLRYLILFPLEFSPRLHAPRGLTHILCVGNT